MAKRSQKMAQNGYSSLTIQQLIPLAAQSHDDAIKAFRGIGDKAVPELLNTFKDFPSYEGTDWRDVHDNLAWALREACHDRADELLRRIRDGGMTDDLLRTAIGALGGSRDPNVYDALERALKHRDGYVRTAAADALIRRRETRAVGALIESLRVSRHSDVTFSIISGMRETPEMQDVRAIPVLEHLLAHRKLELGTKKYAIALLSTLRQLKLPPEKVTRIDWSNQKLNARMMAYGSQCTRVKTLELEEVSGLNAAKLKEICNWTALEEITLKHLDARCPNLSPLGNLINLKRLTLVCDTEVRMPCFLVNLSRLAELTIELFIPDEALADIAKMTRLRVLRWDYIDHENSIQWFAKMKRIESLDFGVSLDVSVISPDAVAYLANLKRLRELKITHSCVDDECLARLMPLTQLKRLTLRGGKITANGLRALAAFPNLTYLDLWGSPIGNAGVRELSKFPQLKYLNLLHTGLTRECIPDLEKMPNLKGLDVCEKWRNPYRAIRKAIPTLKLNSWRIEAESDA